MMGSQTFRSGRRTRKRWLPSAACLWAMAALFACSDPDSSITRSTDDGAFALTLKAKKNWVRPGDVLPIQVRLVSLRGELEETLSGRIEFVANVGRLDVDYLDFTLTGTSDALATEYETVFSDWIRVRQLQLRREGAGRGPRPVPGSAGDIKDPLRRGEVAFRTDRRVCFIQRRSPRPANPPAGRRLPY